MVLRRENKLRIFWLIDIPYENVDLKYQIKVPLNSIVCKLICIWIYFVSCLHHRIGKCRGYEFCCLIIKMPNFLIIINHIDLWWRLWISNKIRNYAFNFCSLGFILNFVLKNNDVFGTGHFCRSLIPILNEEK